VLTVRGAAAAALKKGRRVAASTKRRQRMSIFRFYSQLINAPARLRAAWKMRALRRALSKLVARTQRSFVFSVSLW
jgi:hypothetical protein